MSIKGHTLTLSDKSLEGRRSEFTVALSKELRGGLWNILQSSAFRGQFNPCLSDQHKITKSSDLGFFTFNIRDKYEE